MDFYMTQYKNKVQAQILGGKFNPKTNKYEGAFRYFQRLASKDDDPRQALAKFVIADVTFTAPGVVTDSAV